MRVLIALCLVLFAAAVSAQGARELYLPVGEFTKAPHGWTQFCKDHPRECNTPPIASPSIIMLNDRSWKALVDLNNWVNTTIKYKSDLDKWGVIEKWAYPDDGYGDCEDYALLKKRRLIEAGWPREALLLTMVREKSGAAHAVLTVITDRGEFILDNQNIVIAPWHDAGYYLKEGTALVFHSYRFVKRQSLQDPNVWVSLEDPRGAYGIARR